MIFVCFRGGGSWQKKFEYRKLKYVKKFIEISFFGFLRKGKA